MRKLKYIWVTLAIVAIGILIWLLLFRETRIDLIVRLIQQSGDPIEGATISIRNQMARTDESGDAKLASIAVQIGESLAVISEWKAQKQETAWVVTGEMADAGFAELTLLWSSVGQNAASGRLRVKLSAVTGPVEIVIEDDTIGSSPLFRELASGSYHVRMLKDGFISRDTLIEIESGKRLEFTAVLEKKKPVRTQRPAIVEEPTEVPTVRAAIRHGQVEINDMAEGARIFVDGDPVNVTVPNTILTLTEGDHIIVVAQGSIVDTLLVAVTPEAPVIRSVEYHQCFMSARVAFDSGDFRTTADLLEKCNLSRFSADTRKDALYLLGVSNFNIRRYAKAEEGLRRLTDLAHDHALGHYYLGQTLQQLGRYDEALTAFDEAKRYDHKIDPRDRESIRNKLNFYASICYCQIYQESRNPSDRERAVSELIYFLEKHCTTKPSDRNECATANRYLAELKQDTGQ